MIFKDWKVLFSGGEKPTLIFLMLSLGLKSLSSWYVQLLVVSLCDILITTPAGQSAAL
jgi:hypothetical protein